MRWANTGATRAMLLTLEHGNPATLTSSTPSHHEHSLRHYPPAVHITPHYARGQGSHAQCTRRTPRGRQESHVARRSAGGGHGKGANRVLNRRHSTRHSARGAAPRCEGHERHHGIKATVEITHGWKTRCNAAAAHRLPWLRVFRYQHFATNRSRIPLRFPHLSQRISEVLKFFQTFQSDISTALRHESPNPTTQLQLLRAVSSCFCPRSPFFAALDNHPLLHGSILPASSRCAQQTWPQKRSKR